VTGGVERRVRRADAARERGRADASDTSELLVVASLM